jgi:long-subunit acyl-CoA synthetase (AMP-forming)
LSGSVNSGRPYFDDQKATEAAFNAQGWFMTGDLGWIDLEQKTLQPLDNPFGTGLSPMS